ncbi:MAG: hypothetical protein Q8P41_26695 [Pseudomonadota bacterium]|nr:hypothetical protein [Pseudomonadota bacterium]
MTTDLSRENAALRAALAAAQASIAELRADNAALRSELGQARGQLDELLQLAATQNEHLSDMRTMLRRRMTQRKKGAADAPSPTDPEGDRHPQAGTLPRRRS